MSLSDVMAGAGLAGFAEIALVLFLVAFVGVVVQVASRRHRGAFQAESVLPFDDDTVREAPEASSDGN